MNKRIFKPFKSKHTLFIIIKLTPEVNDYFFIETSGVESTFLFLLNKFEHVLLQRNR